jgi:hypothetical protein
MATTPPAAPPAAAAAPNIQSAPPLVGFNLRDVPPTQNLYVQLNDFIAFRTTTNIAGCIVDFKYRWLTPAGDIKEGEIFTPPFSNTNVIFIPPFEGWLLSFSATLTQGAVTGQWAFCQALILRTTVNLLVQNAYALLWQDYLYSNTNNGWPGTIPKQITDGPGTLRSITGSTPAAGAEINEVVPASRRWNLLAFSATLVTSVAVANRAPAILIDDGVTQLFASAGLVTQAASLTLRWNASPFVVTGGVQTTLGEQMMTPTPFPLKAGFRIRTSTTALQAADQWSAPQYLVQEWGLWDS